MAGQVIRLEQRVLPAATTNLGDFNGDTDFQNDSSNAREYTTIGTKTFFTYNTQVTNKPILAFKDSSTGVTTILPDQTNFRFSPNTQISELTVYNGKLYFVATDGNPGMGLGQELWSLDPATINPATSAATFTCITDYDGTHATNINGNLNSGINAKQATDAATNFSRNEGSAPQHLTVFKGKLYFTASDDPNGLGANREMWSYDGTQVTMLKTRRGVVDEEINPTPNFNSGSSDPQQLTNANDVYLYFTAVDAVGNGRELWRTDGTAAGTIALGDNLAFGPGATNIRGGGQDAGVVNITPATGGVVYFSANDGSHGYELWRSDGNQLGNGTTTGTFMVKDIQQAFGTPPVNQGSNPSSLLFMNNVLYFNADDGIVGKELWKSDGTAAGTTLIKDIAQTGPGGVFDVKQNSSPHNLTQVGNLFYFSANDGKEGFELWKSDGTAAGTSIVHTVNDPNSSDPNHLFAGINRGKTSSGDATASSYPGSLLNVSGDLYFIATNVYTVNGQTNFELYRVDASGPFAGLIRNAGNEQNALPNIWQSQFDVPDPQQDFTYAKSSADSFHPTEVIQDKSPTGFRTDASNRQLFLGPAGSGLIYFTADNGADGTKSIDFTGGSSAFVGVTTDNIATRGALGAYNPNFEPWSYNTSTSATSIVKDMTVQSLTSLNPFGFTTTSVNYVDSSTGVFTTQTRNFFFFTDPRTTSKNIGLAYTVIDPFTGAVTTTDTGLRFDSIGTPQRPNPAVFNSNSILFIANGKEVWRTNGTMTGTECVGSADVSIDLLTVSGNRYFYYGVNETIVNGGEQDNGELWSGTTQNATAELVREIAPIFQNAQHSSDTRFIVPAGNGAVWFNADDYGATNNGRRDVLWISAPDDNTIGTRMVVSGAAFDPVNNPTGPQGPRFPFAQTVGTTPPTLRAIPAASSANGNFVYYTNGSTLFRSTLVFNAQGAIDQANTDKATFALATGVGTITKIITVQNGVYFVGGNGSQLYFSDGSTANGAFLIGSYSSLSDLTVVGNQLYFVNSGTQLFSSVAPPGTSAAPTAPTLINAGLGQSGINNLVISGTAANHSLYFGATTAAFGQELWVSVNAAPPTRVTDIQANSASSLSTAELPNSPLVLHSQIGIATDSFGITTQVFFGAVDPTGSESLYSVPVGTTTATPLHDVVHPTTASSNARDFIVFDPDSFSNFASQPSVYFFSDVGPQRSVLAALSTDPLNPNVNVDLSTIDTYRDWGRTPGDAQFFDDFSANESQSESIPFQYEHFGEYGHPNSDIGIYKSGKMAMANRTDGHYLNEQFLFYSGFNGDNTGGTNPFNFGQELYVIYQGAPVRITNLRVASNSAQGNANPGYMTSIGNDADGESTFVMFAASNGPSQGSLYKVTVPATGDPSSWAVGTVGSVVNPRYLQSLGGGQGTGGLIYFTAGPENDRTAYATDGSSVVQLSTAIVDESAGDGHIFGYSNGKVYFSARDPNSSSDNFELYMTDHAQLAVTTGSISSNSAKTVLGTNVTGLLREINPSATAGSRPGNFTDVNGTLYFAANDGIDGFELWSTDGTSVGTQMVKSIDSNGKTVDQINPGAAGSNPGVEITTKTDTDLNGVSTTHFVYTYTGFAVANTRPDEFGVTNAGINAPDQQNPAKPNSGDNNGTPTLIFAATTPQYGRELWQVTPNSFSTTVWSATDAKKGTTTVIDGVTFNSTTSTVTFIFDGALQTINGVTAAQLAQGVNFTSLGVTYLFKSTLYTGHAGMADLVKDIAPGARSSNPENLTAIDGTVYMSADDGLSGDTLWSSVGLDQITGNTLTVKMIDDASLFAGNSALTNGIRNPDDFTFLSTDNNTISRLIFTAGNDLGKTEVYTLNINHTPTKLNMTSVAVPENLPQGTLVGQLGTTDPDPGDSFQYKFVAGAGDTDNALFQIVGTSLQIKSPLDFETKSTYTVRIRTTDQRGQFYEKSFTVNVTDVNEFGKKPNDPNVSMSFLDPVTSVVLPGDTFRIDEIPSIAPADPAPTTSDIDVAKLVALNDDAITGNNQFTIVPGQLDASSFVIFSPPGVAPTLRLKAGAVLNFEKKGQYQVNVQLQDPSVAGSTPIVRTFTLILNDLNESPIGPLSDSDATSDTVVGGTQFNGAVDENSAAGTTVGITALAIDPDTQLNPVTYTLTNNAGGRFQIDPNTGVISVRNGSLLDYETTTQYSVDVRADSTDGSFSTATFNIQINDVDEFDVSPIVDSNNATNQVVEGAANGTQVGLTAFAFDADGSNNTVTYSLTADAGGRFAIDPVTGIVTVANGALLDREQAAAWSITVKAQSTDGSFSVKAFSISILDVNEFAVGPISDVDPSLDKVPEGSPNGTPVGITAKAVDKDATNNTVTYSLTANAGGRFAIDPVTGVISVANTALIDAEAASAWSVTVQATSADGSTSQKAFTITIGDVNEFAIGAVSDTNNAINAVDENAANGTTVGITAKAIDKDVTAKVSYSLTSDAGGRFQIDPTTGIVTVKNGLLLNREVNASHTITILASSDDGSTSSATFTITVNDVNEFPVGPVTNVGSGNTTIPENSPNGTLVGITANAVDPDATNNQVTYSLTNNAGGRFTINPLTGVVTVANSALLDREAAASYQITIQAKSSDNSTSSANFTINLTDVNDNTVSAIQDTNPTGNTGTFNGVVNEGAPTGTLVGITASATDPDVSNVGHPIVYSLQDTAGGRFKIDPSTGVVSVDDGTKIDYETSTSNTIIVKATAFDGSFTTKTFVISVNNVAETPTLALSNTTVDENLAAGAVVGVFSVKDALPTSPVYTLVSGTGSTDNAKFQIVGNQLRTNAKFDFETKSTYTVRVQMKSSNGITVTQVFTIKVNNVNEAPTKIALSKASVSKRAAVGTVVGTLSATDPDAGQTFTYTLVSGTGSTDNAKFLISGNQLKVNAPLGTGTKASIRVRVTDQNGLWFEQTFTITLTT